MKKEYNYNIRDFQLHSKTILDAIDIVCHEHGLTYYIIAGTLLGAVRHKGFIPWDDDIDIALPRKDYDTLLLHAKEWLPERYNLVTYESDHNYPKYFAKIEDCHTTLVENFSLGYIGGVYVDVFPLDDVPNNSIKRNLHYRKFHFFRKLQYYAYRDPYKHGRSVGAHIMALFQKCLSKEYLNKCMQRVLVEYRNHKNCDFVMTHDDGTCAYPKSCLAAPNTYSFEGKEYDGPSDADTFLASYYGKNYMQLPPVEKRRSHYHDYCDLKNGYLGVDIESLKTDIMN